MDGPYNEHLIRDVGALNLALAAVLIVAAITLHRLVIVTAAVGSITWGIPHVIFHGLNTTNHSAGDIVGILSGLTVFAVLPVALIITSVRSPICPEKSE